MAAPDWLNRIAAAHTSEYKVVGGSVRNGTEKTIWWRGPDTWQSSGSFLPGKPKMEVSHIPTCNISLQERNI